MKKTNGKKDLLFEGYRCVYGVKDEFWFIREEGYEFRQRMRRQMKMRHLQGDNVFVLNTLSDVLYEMRVTGIAELIPGTVLNAPHDFFTLTLFDGTWMVKVGNDGVSADKVFRVLTDEEVALRRGRQRREEAKRAAQEGVVHYVARKDDGDGIETLGEAAVLERLHHNPERYTPRQRDIRVVPASMLQTHNELKAQMLEQRAHMMQQPSVELVKTAKIKR